MNCCLHSLGCLYHLGCLFLWSSLFFRSSSFFEAVFIFEVVFIFDVVFIFEAVFIFEFVLGCLHFLLDYRPTWLFTGSYSDLKLSRYWVTLNICYIHTYRRTDRNLFIFTQITLGLQFLFKKFTGYSRYLISLAKYFGSKRNDSVIYTGWFNIPRPVLEISQKLQIENII